MYMINCAIVLILSDSNVDSTSYNLQTNIYKNSTFNKTSYLDLTFLKNLERTKIHKITEILYLRVN